LHNVTYILHLHITPLARFLASEKDSYQRNDVGTRSEILSSTRKVRPSGPRSAHVIRLRRDTTRRVFPFSLGGWPSFVDGLHRSTETVARKRASATKRTPTTVTSYTTDFISLCYVTFLDETSDAGSLSFLSVSLSAYRPRSFSYASASVSRVFIIPVGFSNVPFPFTYTHIYIFNLVT